MISKAHVIAGVILLLGAVAADASGVELSEKSQRLTVSGCLTSVSLLSHNRDDGDERFASESFRQRLATTALHRIEGIWRLTSGGGEIGILRKSEAPAGGGKDVTEYEIIILGASDRALRAGTVIGTLRPTAKASVYQAHIYTRQAGSRLYDARTFMLRLDAEENRIVFERKKSNLSVNLWRLLPYLWRAPVERRSEPAATEGAIRIYPQPATPIEPRYL